MFYLSLIEHTLRLPPHLLALPLQDAIKKELEDIFLDKVIANLGLCISIYDVKHISGGFIFPAEGASTYTVEFRMVVFRPFVGEIIVARLKESNSSGLRLSLGFFDDIYIPEYYLPTPKEFVRDRSDRDEGLWKWNYGEGEYVIDGIDEIKFCVQSISYPPIPIEQKENSENPEKVKSFAPMVITGTVDGDSLGPVSWW